MCLLVPGKIVEINNNEVVVDYEIEKRKGKIIEGDYRKGDYVIIQGGIVIQKINKKEAISSLKLYKKSQKVIH